MIDALRKQIEARISSVDVNHLRQEFVAWWNGKDRPELSTDEETPPDDTPQTDARPAAPAREPTPEELLKLRILIAESLWGEGFVGPGDFAFVMEQISQFGLSKEHSVCILGSGLAGAARAITKETGTWITAFEEKDDIIPIAREQCAVAGLAKRVVVTEFDPKATEIPESKFHVILSFDRFYAIEDKKTVLGRCKKALTGDGGLLITDYVVPRAPEEGRAEEWFDPFWGKPHLATAQNYINMFKAMKMDLRVKKDITADYVRMINTALPKWKDLLELANEPEVDGISRAAFAKFLAQEAETWAKRMEALSKGELQVYRFLAM